MNLRIRTILAVAALMVGVVMAFYWLTRTVMLNRFIELEEQSAKVAAQQAALSIQRDVSDLGRLTLNYAQWDETYRYVIERDPEYLVSSLNAATFSNYSLDNVIIFDRLGRVVYEATYNPQTNNMVEGARSLVNYIRNIEAAEVRFFLTRPADAGSGVSGLILLPEGPMLISAQPILPTGGTGVITGSLVLGRYLGALETQRLTEQLQAAVSFAMINSTTTLPADFDEANQRITTTDPIYVATQAEVTQGYASLTDIINRRSLLIRVDKPREIYAAGLAMQRPLLLGFGIGGLAVTVAVTILIVGVIFWPFKSTQKAIQTIRQKKALNVRLSVRGKDDVASLLGEINNLLSDLEQASQDAVQSKGMQQRLLQAQSVRQVMQAVNSTLSRQQIYHSLVAEMGDRFGYYYVGLFLVDETNLNAILRAGTGNVVPEGYQLTVGGSSTVGMAIARKQIQIAEIGARKDQISFTRLPMARCEIAIPVRHNNNVLGAIAIQSTQADTFQKAEDQEILQYLADYVGVVLATAHWVEDLQNNYKNLDASYQQVLTERWGEELRLKGDLAYTFQIRSDGKNKDEVHLLQLPIELNGVKLGWVELDTERATWPAEDRAMLDALLLQMTQALENARLLERSQRRATQERLVAEVTRAVRASTDVDTILHTSVLELGRVLRASMAEMRIQPTIMAATTGQLTNQPLLSGDDRRSERQPGDADEPQEVTA
jgi:sensor domain CHASE-containing protein/putative methionine-R-sulfoxide reductase with GAF domain